MVPGGGTLQLRGAEPYSLDIPTEFTGSIDDQTGVISAGALATPQVSFEQAVTSPLSATAFIDAEFSQVTPGSGSGTVDEFGNVVINEQLAVDLHIEVVPTGASTPLQLAGDCTAAPISLNLTSTVPYDVAAEEVTLSDPNFTVPPVPITERCSELIANAINNQLAGGGHSLSVLFEGNISLPPPAGCATTTDVEVAPVGGSATGDEVTLTATVEPVADDPECVTAETDGDPLVGSVDFRDGNHVIATVTLDGSGQAVVATTTLPAGSRLLSARYRGSPPYQASTSDATTYTITARPAVTTDFPAVIEIGAAPVEFDVTVSNTGFGAALDGNRLDITVKRAPGSISPFSDAHVNLEFFDNADWVPVALTSPVARTVLGSLGPVGAFDVAPGGEATQRARVAIGFDGDPAPLPGPLDVSLELVDGETSAVPSPAVDPMAAGSVASRMVNQDRTPTTIGFGSAGQGGPVSPHTVRAGNSIVIPNAQVLPNLTGLRATGIVEILLDGVVVPFGRGTGLLDPGFLTRHTIVGGSIGSPVVNLPVDIAPGTHTFTIRYWGDEHFEGSTSVPAPFTVVPPVGAIYECTSEGVPAHRYRAQMVAQANLPATAPAGSTVDLDHLSVRILTDRSQQTTNSFSGLLTNDAVNTIGSPQSFEGVSMDIGPDSSGRGTATGIDRRNGVRLPNDPNPATTDIDHSLTFLGETGEVVIDGDIGDVVPVTLDAVQIDLRTTALGIPYNERCIPVGDPITLGSVTVSGVDLEVTPGSPVRAGQEVALSASTAPATSTGVVEFRDGTTTIGVVPVVAGAASMTTTELELGNHSLSARFYPQPMAPVLVSVTVDLAVLPEFDCPDFADEGNGAVVRLVYLELLGRCPDQAGFDYWTGRLGAGVSPEVFARTISATDEAVGMVVDDAYQTMLGRSADAAGKAFWVNRMITGTGRYDQLLADLGASDEFWTKAGATNEGFVTRVYDRLLHRAPDQSGLDHWTGRLAAGVSRRALIRSLANLDEPLGVLVTQSYDEILSRTPFTGERATGITFLRATGDRSALYAQLIGRPEFTTRAQSFPNPED